MTSPALDQEVAEPTPGRRPGWAFASWTARLAAHSGIPVVAFSAVYLVATSLLAVRRPLWNDELYTYHFARVSDVADLWRALETGADQAPPLSYLLSRASVGALGNSAFALRLPEILAFLLFSICIYAFVARRTTKTYGLIAMLLPTLTAAYYYASEARAYALVLGFGALTLVCWQLATESVNRRIALGGLFVALALATSSHYYAVLLVLPLGLGELARTLAARRIDMPVWVAFSGAIVPLAAFAPLLSASRGYAVDFWGRPSWQDPLRFFSFLLDPSVTSPSVMSTGRPTDRGLILVGLVVLVAAVLVLTTGRGWLRSLPRRRRALPVAIGCGLAGAVVLAGAAVLTWRELAIAGLVALVVGGYLALRAASGRPLLAGPPGHEVVALAGFLFLPFAAVVVAETVTHAYAARYALAGVVGLTLVPLALHRLEGRRRYVGASVAAILTAAFVATVIAHERAASRSAEDQRGVLAFLAQNAGTGAPILIDNPHQFLELSYAASPDLARRFVYVADPGWDSTQRGLLALGPIARLRVYDRSDLYALPPSLVALSTRREAGWSDTRTGWSALPALSAEGRGIVVKAAYGEQALYSVSPGAGP
jgi:4-amino-4-deoxy-L-arabinose transferase-like glycosyltransferase